MRALIPSGRARGARRCGASRVYPARVHQIVNIIGPTFFAVALGYLFGRVTKASMALLIDISMYVAVPAWPSTPWSPARSCSASATKLWARLAHRHGGQPRRGLLVFGALRQKHSGLYLPIVFTNYINIPLPIIFLAFGDEGAAHAILMYIPHGLLIYSLGVYVASGREGHEAGPAGDARDAPHLRGHPGAGAQPAARAPPAGGHRLGRLLGQAGVPLMLLILGMSIGRFRFKQIPLTLAASVLRVGGGFALRHARGVAAGLTGVARAVVLFEAAMPAAVFVSVLAAKYKNEDELVSSVVLATTLMAIAVIPALLYFLT